MAANAEVLKVKSGGVVHSITPHSFSFFKFSDCEVVSGKAYYKKLAVELGAKPSAESTETAKETKPKRKKKAAKKS